VRDNGPCIECGSNVMFSTRPLDMDKALFFPHGTIDLTTGTSLPVYEAYESLEALQGAIKEARA